MAKDIYIETLKILDDSKGMLSNTELAHLFTKMIDKEVVTPLFKMVTEVRSACKDGE